MERINFEKPIYKEIENIPEEKIEQKEKEKIFDVAIVYGEGPVIEVFEGFRNKKRDEKKRKFIKKKERFEKKSREDTISYKFEGYLNTCAAGHLYQEGKIKKIIVTGGKTGYEESPSEGEIMAKILQKEFKVPEGDIIIEDAASNTIENAVYTIDTIDENPEKYKNIVSIAAAHHLERTEVLNNLLGIDAKYLSSEEILLSPDGNSIRFKPYIDEIYKKAPVYKKRGRESKRWLRGLKEIPEYWLPQAAKVKSLKRFREILKQESVKDWVQKKFNIENPDKLSDAGLKSVKEQIMKIKRIIPTEEWEE